MTGGFFLSRYQFLLLLCLAVLIGKQEQTAVQALSGSFNFTPTAATTLANANTTSLLYPWSFHPSPARQPVSRICFHFSPDVSPAMRGEVLTLIGHVPHLTTGQTCLGDNDLTIAVSADDRLAPEEIFLSCPQSPGARTLTVKSGTGGEADSPIGIALFRALELLGFAFLHPLDPNVPSRATFPADSVLVRETPHLRIRGIHLHTMHPTEFADFLNGWGPNGIDDEEGFDRMFVAWKSFLGWMRANGLNRVQWVLLENEKWADFATSALRQARLRQIVAMAHEFGVMVGIDAPVSLRQQNAFRLVPHAGEEKEELDQIQSRIDYLMLTGIDYLALESGTSEFTHASPARMLARLNFITAYLNEMYKKTATIKVHVSAGQRTDDLIDPVDGGALNINYLPWYADPALGVMPHTVAYYGLTDPAPVYGNRNFKPMAAYMQREIGEREVIFYPESAYWCSVDVDVPLFMPLYAERRLNDLRRLERERRQRPDGLGIDGQVIFSSGWEWGYWLGDVVAARAAWNPLMEKDNMEEDTDDAAFVALLEQVLSPFEESAYTIASQVADVAFTQRQLLIRGANSPDNPLFDETLTGQAYLQGVEPLDEMVLHLAHLPGAALTATQPARTPLMYGAAPGETTVSHMFRLKQLLAAMRETFSGQSQRLHQMSPVIDPDALGLYSEIRDSLEITAMRATQAEALFLNRLAAIQGDVKREKKMARVSETAIARAMQIVQRRELAYRVPLRSVATWRTNPTAYGFGYLWTAHSLYYWRRDHLKLITANDAPCIANIYDPFELAFGTPSTENRMHHLMGLFSMVSARDWRPCLTINVPPDWLDLPSEHPRPGQN